MSRSINSPGYYYYHIYCNYLHFKLQVREIDCIKIARETIIDSQLATKEEIKEIDNKVKKVVNEAVDFAIASPEPDLSEVYTHVYSKLPYTVRGREPGEEYVVS